jgi:RNA polymerase sigma factor (TIGR02999 family)
MADPSDSVTRLLRAWEGGDLQARDELLPLVYGELRRRAGAYFRGERPNHTLQPTALVNETYLRLVAQHRVPSRSRAHFFSLAATMMRRVLVDHAREYKAAKRPPAGARVTLDEGDVTQPRDDVELLLLDEALSELSALDSRQGQIVELRYFGGLSEHEAAEVLAISRATISREWRTARMWLARRMTAGRPRTNTSL